MASVGDLVSYLFTVTNTGSVTLTNVTLVDPLPGLSLGVLTDAGFDGTTVLGPGAVETAIGTYALTQADIDAPYASTAGDVDNTASATGTDPGGVRK